MSSWTKKAHELRTHQAQQLATVITDHQIIDTRTYTATAGGDNQALRGIPAIGRGVTGAIPGSSPHAVQ